MSLPRELPRELQGSGAAYSGGACRSPSVRRLGAALLCGEGMRGGPPARRNVRAAEYFSPVPFAAAALLFPNPFSPRFLPPSSSLRRLGAALLRGGGDAGRSIRPSECAGGGVFLPGSFCCCRPSFPESFLSPVPSAIVLPSALGSGPPPRRRGCGAVHPPVGMCGRRSVSLRFLPPPPPSFSRCRSGPRDFSGKRCGGEK